MFKDRLILAMLVACFALTGFGCDETKNNPGDGEMPDRAGPANPLLRHYFDTNTFPAEMGAWKIPEGDRFKDKRLELNFGMGGGEVVNDVRVRLYIVPPPFAQESTPDVMVRVIAPDDTHSAWTEVSFMSYGGDEGGGGGGGSGEVEYIIDLQAEVIFQNSFNGVISTGNWKVQLRDPIEDEDGRCLLRNATLRLNLGLPTGSASGTEAAIVPLDVGPYHRRLPELDAPRLSGDLGHIGVKKPLKLHFTFTNSFAVRGFDLQFTIRSTFQADPSPDLWICIISPSGGWFQPSEITKDTHVIDTAIDSSALTADQWTTYFLSSDQAFAGVGNSFPFLGEPSAGTWTVLIWEKNMDGAGLYLSPDEAQGNVLVPNVPAQFALF